MIFCARQLIEKAIEHNTKIFMLFIDLQKTYDSVPSQALWHALESYGIPESRLQMIHSLHDCMKAEVTVNNRVASEFKGCNGLRQESVLAPTCSNKASTVKLRMREAGGENVGMAWKILKRRECKRMS